MKYAVTTTIDGASVEIICKDTDEFIDVCEALGENVLKVVQWNEPFGIREEIEIDWL